MSDAIEEAIKLLKAFEGSDAASHNVARAIMHLTMARSEDSPWPYFAITEAPTMLGLARMLISQGNDVLGKCAGSEQSYGALAGPGLELDLPTTLPE